MSPAAEPQREMLSLVTARIRDAYLRKPFYVDGGLDLVSVCRELQQRGLTQALVRDTAPDGQPRVGIFTTTDLRDALLRPEPPAQLPVREVARFELVGVDADADLFEALWLMVRHRVHRLVVRDAAGAVVGVLGQLDLVSFVANHSHIVALQIDEAASVAELRAAALRIDEMVTLLHGSGIRIERITRLVSELNTRLFARLWAVLAPPEVVAGSCLLVMGSEGRGEQILKTDQDNALLLRDGFAPPDLEALARDFNGALAELGYPRCPGDIMLTNPLWRQPLSTFRETIRHWVYGQGPDAADGPMHLAIFFDAAAVAGDTTLLQEAKLHLDEVLNGQDTWLARFAAAADQFQEPGNWFTRLTKGRDEQPLDLKKLGTFPIVHGVRALALQHGVRESGTAARLAALSAADKLDATLARDLVDALHLLMGIRLNHQLKQRAAGQAATNEVRPSDLSTLEREPLHDALGIVRRFRTYLRQHFRFDSL
jgi:CBS domain-containing protein